jgi:hypothetical protein
MGHIKPFKGADIAQRRKNSQQIHNTCRSARQQRRFYALPKVLNNREGKARWIPYYYLPKILLNYLELAELFFTRCTHRAGWVHCRLSLAGGVCGIGKS